MSRAFVKESDDAEVPVPERMVSPAPNRVTARGARLIEQEIERLEQRVSEKPPADDLRILRRDLRYWQARHATMDVIHPDAGTETIALGTSALIKRAGRTSTVTIVGEDEADPASGLIAWTAPLARALEGAEPGDTIELNAAGRDEVVEVLSVTARDDDA